MSTDNEKAFEEPVKYPEIQGISKINHNDRVRLGLNCSEYVLIDYLDWLIEQKHQFEAMRCYISIGFKADEVSTIMQSLIQKGFLIETEDKIQVTDKWRGKMKQYEKEFETFWVETTLEGKIRTAWAGSKPEAQKLFVKLRKTYSFEYLMGQRNDYFKYLEYQQKIRKFDQQRMMCTVFLNPAKERFAEKWASYIPETKKEEPAQKPMTQEELNKQYE